MHEWSDFFVAAAGSAAALTGLIFVGISISLNRIISYPTLPARALISLALLVSILIFSLLMLVPGQSDHTIGLELTIIGAIIWIAITVSDIMSMRKKDRAYKKQQLIIALINQLCLLPYIFCGIKILVTGEHSIYWILPGILVSFVKAALDAWVLLVEINR